MRFVWNRRNVEHIGKHGVLPDEAAYIVESAKPPFPQMIGEDKRLVVGQLRLVSICRWFMFRPNRFQVPYTSFIAVR